MDKQTIIESLLKCKLFDHVVMAELIPWQSHFESHTYAKGAIIFREHCRSDTLFVIHSGRVRFEWYSPEGDSLLINFAADHNFFNEVGMFDDWIPDSRGTAESTSTLIEIHKTIFLDMFKSVPKIAQNLARISTLNSRALTNIQMKLKTKKVEYHLLRIILQLFARFKQTSADLNVAELPYVAINNEDLASMLSVSRQTVNGFLNQWRKLGWIDLHYGKIYILNLPAMQSCLDSLED